MPLFQNTGLELIFLSGCPNNGVHRRVQVYKNLVELRRIAHDQ
jgi:hypothetical protein